MTYPYADGYLTIYLCGSLFVMVSLGMNQFINAQGFGRKGMMTVAIGAVTNIVLDPIFIFVFHMGVQGAALATILPSSCRRCGPSPSCGGERPPSAWSGLPAAEGPAGVEDRLPGLSSLVMAITNSIVQVACNSTLQTFGGDLYGGS